MPTPCLDFEAIKAAMLKPSGSSGASYIDDIEFAPQDIFLHWHPEQITSLLLSEWDREEALHGTVQTNKFRSFSWLHHDGGRFRNRPRRAVLAYCLQLKEREYGEAVHERIYEGLLCSRGFRGLHLDPESTAPLESGSEGCPCHRDAEGPGSQHL
jgi:hypothetical protein